MSFPKNSISVVHELLNHLALFMTKPLALAILSASGQAHEILVLIA